MTNPQRNTKLRADDIIFVLSQTDPNKTTNFEYKQQMNLNKNKDEASFKSDELNESVDLQPKLLIRQATKTLDDYMVRITNKIERLKNESIEIQKIISERDATLVGDIGHQIH